MMSSTDDVGRWAGARDLEGRETGRVFKRRRLARS